MTFSNLEPQLKQILKHYSETFSSKIYVDENHETDPLMDIFGITPAIKRENKQYWGRELGMCWQRIVAELFRMTCEDYLPALRLGDDEPCDCIVGLEAIDTKYRIGSGDSGTLKKFNDIQKQFQAKVKADEDAEREAKAVEAAEIKARNPVITGQNVQEKVKTYEKKKN